MSRLWSAKLRDDPEAFVMFVFPWGEKGTPLEKRSGPRKWQRDILRKIKDAHRGKRRPGHVRGIPPGGGLGARNRKVGAGELARAVDALDADRRERDRVSELRSAAQKRDLGRDHEVAGDADELALVRDQRHADRAGEVAHRTGGARPEKGHALLGRGGQALERRESGCVRWRAQRRRHDGRV
jgi:hypothetical protein